MQNSQIKTHHLINNPFFPLIAGTTYPHRAYGRTRTYPFAVSVLCQSASRPWKRLPVSCLQLFDGHVCVTLCGLQRGMPQHLLHLTQVRSPVEHMGRRTVAQRMRTDVRHAGLPCPVRAPPCAPYVDRSARPAIPKRTRRPTCHRIVRDGHVPANHARPCRLVHRMA